MAADQAVILRPAALEAVRREAAAAHPRECCGLLLGKEGCIRSAVPIRNVATDRSRFELDALELMRAERGAREAGVAVVGYYHSHPGGDPRPSRRDRTDALWPDAPPFFHLIFGLPNCWRLYNTRGGSWRAVPVRVADG